MEELVNDIGTANRAGEPTDAIRMCSQALDLFRGKHLAGLPGRPPNWNGRGSRERKIAIVQRRLEYQLRLGQCFEAIAELFALFAEHPRAGSRDADARGTVTADRATL